MKALLYLGEKRLSVTDVPDPSGAFLVRVHGCTICGTDLKTYLHGHPKFVPPCILGHEFIGTVERAPEACGFVVGDPVVVAPYGECGTCELCMRGAGELCRNMHRISTGAFCELVEVPEDFIRSGVIKLDELNDAYTLVEPLACVLTAMNKIRFSDRSRVLIAGGGPMGTLFALMLKAKGMDVAVSEPDALRRERLRAFGVVAEEPGAIDASKFDVIIVAVNLPALAEQYVSTIADGGTVHVFAGMQKDVRLAVDAYSVHYRGVTLTGSSGFNLPMFRAAYDIIRGDKQRFLQLITHVFELNDAVEALETQSSGKAFKVLIRP